MRPLLRDYALAIGVPRHISQYHENTLSMYRQIMADADKLCLDERDADTAYINCRNGTVHIKNGVHVLKSFNKADGLTYILGYNYDPQAKAPKFHRFLNQILPDKSLRDVVAEYVAYALAEHKRRQKAMFFYGKGANGKGTLIDIIAALLGHENVVERSCDSLCDENSRTVADLDGKLLNMCSEMSKKVNITNFKLLASGDPIMARRLYGEPYTITNYAKLLFSCNELPRSIEHNHAYFRRLILVSFEHTVADGEMNHRLAEEIAAEELSGVLNWVLEGYERLTKQGYFTESKKAKEELENYAIESDAVASFIYYYQYCPVPMDKKTEMKLSKLYEDFKMYCAVNNFQVCNSNTFGAKLRGMNYQLKRMSAGNLIYIGKIGEKKSEVAIDQTLWNGRV